MDDDLQNEISERQNIEDYLKLYCIEDLLDETINTIIEQRPSNPYTQIARLIESKSMSEILDVKISTVIVGGYTGVQTLLTTNLGQFLGYSSFPYSTSVDGFTLLRDYTIIQEKVTDALKPIDPKNLQRMDECIDIILKEDSVVQLSLSIACCRAAARHKSLPLYKFISELAETEICLPLPVPTMLSRACGGVGKPHTQQISLLPTETENIQEALESLIHANHRLQKQIKDNNCSITPSDTGSIRINIDGLDKALKLVTTASQSPETPTIKSLLPAIDFHASSLLKEIPVVPLPTTGPGAAATGNTAPSNVPPGSEIMIYQLEGPTGPVKSGVEISDHLIAMMKEFEVLSVEDPLHHEDLTSLRTFYREKLTKAVDAMKLESTIDNASRHLAGIGGQETCFLQLIADTAINTTADIKTLAAEAIYNTFMLRLPKAGNITKAIALCKEARRANLALVIGITKDAPETLDTFLADFSVGVGAGQYYGGGLLVAENLCKYNRLLEISRSDPSIMFVGKYYRR